MGDRVRREEEGEKYIETKRDRESERGKGGKGNRLI